ncbi:hypothetical protein D3C73_1627300 [compost metagenome]
MAFAVPPVDRSLTPSFDRTVASSIMSVLSDTERSAVRILTLSGAGIFLDTTAIRHTPFNGEDRLEWD